MCVLRSLNSGLRFDGLGSRLTSHLALLIGLSLAIDGTHAATVNWNNNSGSNRWDIAGNWSSNPNLPGSSDTARFSTTGSGGTIKLTHNNSFTAGVGTILINATPTQYTDLNAGTGSTAAGVLDFGSSPAGIVYEFTGSGSASSARDFYIGRNRASTGTISTAIDNALNIRVRPGQRLNMFSTISGNGSISLSNAGTNEFVSGHHAALVLGAGDQASDGSMSLGSTFSGGVNVGSTSFLIVGESSELDGGTLVRGPLGTSTLTIGGDATDTATARIGAMRSGTITSGASITLHNAIHINKTGLQTVGGIDMTWAGNVYLRPDNAATFSISVSPAVEGMTSSNKHSLTISGNVDAASGFEKRGFGTLLLSGSNAALAGSIEIANGVVTAASANALGTFTAGTGTTTHATLVNGGTLRFADGVDYTNEELVRITGTGSSGLDGAILGGANANATFRGNVVLTGDATINSGPTSGGLTLANPITSDGSTNRRLTKTGTGVLEA